MKFIQSYGIIAWPLTYLLIKRKFGWNDDAETTFLAIKQAMTTTSILAMSNFNDSFTIVTDALRDRSGIVLSQQDKPIAFISQAIGGYKKILVNLC